MRQAVLKIAPELLGQLFYNGTHYFKVKSGLPDDAKFIKACFHQDKTFHLLYESSTFLNVPQGKPYPVLQSPSFTRIQPKEE